MGKRKNLHGLPNNLIQQYFSTLFYRDCGYMADWIWNASNEKEVTEIEVDILSQTVSPQSLNIEQITGYLDRLKSTIDKELIKNGFQPDFIISAKFIIMIPTRHKDQRLLTCSAILIDEEQRVYRSRPYTQKSYEDGFIVFKKSITERIAKWIRQRLNLIAG